MENACEFVIESSLQTQIDYRPTRPSCYDPPPLLFVTPSAFASIFSTDNCKDWND